MRLLIVSGLSGSGKSIALNVLEDEGYYCIDNLPLGLLKAFALQLINAPQRYAGKAAVGVDARIPAEDLDTAAEALKSLEQMGLTCEIIFLDADDAILLKRFSETRRKHPLSRPNISLAEAVQQERRMLGPLREQAQLYLDTSTTNAHQLRKYLQEQVLGKKDEQSLSLQFQSFGYKHGIPADVDFVFDMRCLPNPHWEPRLRPLTGLDKDVAAFLDQQTLVTEMFQSMVAFLEQWLPHFVAERRRYLTIAVGCTGGQHRSVYMVRRLAEYFATRYENVITRHRELV
ncbi:MAG: RNase adaptor protein RapZ [Gammaproteobacteria bacterium RBG_16_57_12]|nr:MAG: RNase adaptor protein RapZ [Gammaproteobacteria bacterium RBG_16_57_12]